MDIIISGPNSAVNSETAQMIMAKLVGVKHFSDCAHGVSMVTPTLENLLAQPLVGTIIADELPTFVHLVGAKASVAEFRAKVNRPNVIAVYCTTFDPVTGEPVKTWHPKDGTEPEFI